MGELLQQNLLIFYIAILHRIDSVKWLILSSSAVIEKYPPIDHSSSLTQSNDINLLSFVISLFYILVPFQMKMPPYVIKFPQQQAMH